METSQLQTVVPPGPRVPRVDGIFERCGTTDVRAGLGVIDDYELSGGLEKGIGAIGRRPDADLGHVVVAELNGPAERALCIHIPSALQPASTGTPKLAFQIARASKVKSAT